MIEHYANLYYVAGVSIACNICLLFIAGAMGRLLLKQMQEPEAIEWNKLRILK